MTTKTRIPKPKPAGQRATRQTHPDAIWAARMELGLTQREMAAELNRRYGPLRMDYPRIETDRVRSPNPKTRRALCDFFGLPITYFEPD